MHIFTNIIILLICLCRGFTRRCQYKKKEKKNRIDFLILNIFLNLEIKCKVYIYTQINKSFSLWYSNHFTNVLIMMMFLLNNPHIYERHMHLFSHINIYVYVFFTTVNRSYINHSDSMYCYWILTFFVHLRNSN